MDDKPEFDIVSKEAAVNNLEVWIMKGHSPLDTVRIFGAEDNGLYIGFTDYNDPDIVQIPEHMNRSYKNYQGAFTAVGAMFDALDPELM